MSNQGQPPHTPSTLHSLASRGIQPRFGELAQSCRKLVMNHLAEHLGDVFTQVDDTLFTLADKAESNQLQSLFFDNMREIRKQRPQIERSYHQQIARNFSDFFSGQLKPPTSAGAVDAEQLVLVQNEDYEESLQIINMVSRMKAHCAQPLFALEQRLAQLSNGQKLDEDNNPFGPQMIAQAFRLALTPCPFPLRIKIVLYTLFDTQVMDSLEGLYATLNQRLIEAGVLPGLKYSAQRHASPARAAAPASPSHAVSGAIPKPPNTQPSPPARTTAPIASEVPPSDPAELLGSLAALLGEHRRRDRDASLPDGTRSMASLTPRNATRTYSARELLDALNRMQRQSARELAQHLHQPLPVDGLKEALQQQLQAHSLQPTGHRVADPEADVIDLVGMLFDFILDDDNLPDSCKTTLSHLHTPYLKVALQDKALFTQHHHPARRLLNAMAQAGVLYGGENENSGLQAKMQWVVERVVHDFADDLQLFDSLLEEFNAYVATLRHKVELRERRAVQAAKGRDKLLDARQRALAVIAACLKNRALPNIIHNFLELTWADALVFVWLRHGDDSHEWRRACEVAEQLAWSGTPLDEAGRERLQVLRIALLGDLRKGLELLGGYHEDGIHRLLQDLVACQHAVQGKQPQVAERLKSAQVESQLGTLLGEDTPLASPAPQDAGLSPRAQALAKELQQLEFGTWFAFGSGELQQSLKLSWFSPTTDNYMFVDHSGQRAAIKPLQQLAREMERGLARIIPAERDTPLMDRALSAIYRVLQRFSGRPHEPHA
jgi:NTP pyrophosphatase (non-canonical NTP hydrolase)